MIYEMKKKKWEIEIENNKRRERIWIKELRLRLNKLKYIIYKIKLYINFKNKKLKKILNYKYIYKYNIN